MPGERLTKRVRARQKENTLFALSNPNGADFEMAVPLKPTGCSAEARVLTTYPLEIEY